MIDELEKWIKERSIQAQNDQDVLDYLNDGCDWEYQNGFLAALKRVEEKIMELRNETAD